MERHCSPNEFTYSAACVSGSGSYHGAAVKSRDRLYFGSSECGLHGWARAPSLSGVCFPGLVSLAPVPPATGERDAHRQVKGALFPDPESLSRPHVNQKGRVGLTYSRPGMEDHQLVPAVLVSKTKSGCCPSLNLVFCLSSTKFFFC